VGFFRNIFSGSESAAPAKGAKASSYPRISRRSTGFHEFAKAVVRPEGQTVLDLGPTSPDNIAFITNLGHKAYNEDVLSAASDPALMIPGEGDGEKTYDIVGFLNDNLTHAPETFDAVMLWDMCDYLPEPLVKPIIERIHRITKPNGLLLGFFHTKDAGPEAPYYRYHMMSQDTLELQRGPQYRLQRVFANRHVENLFKDYKSLKFFLGKENIREVLIVR
jgi:SAM-dependent methyltransferase